MLNKQDFQMLLGDRALIISLITMILLSLGLAIYGLLNVQVSSIQLPVRYSDYGMTNTYREHWYYLLSFPLFALMIAVIHTLIAVKLYLKNRRLALGFVLLTLAILIFGIRVAAAVSGQVTRLVGA